MDLTLHHGATRNLMQADPPSDTVVTWCPYHHHGYIPTFPGDAAGPLQEGDVDLVLLVDGSVRRVLTQQSQQAWNPPANMSLLSQPAM